MTEGQSLMDKVGLGLSAFGAGVQGKGMEFNQQLDLNRKQAMLQDASMVNDALTSGDVGRARDLLVSRVGAINKLGGDPSDTLGVLNKIESGDVKGALQDTNSLLEYAYDSGFLTRPKIAEKTAGEREFNALADAGQLSKDEEKLAARIQLGLTARAVGSAAQTIAAEGSAEDVGRSEAVIAGAKSGAQEAARLEEQLKLSPLIAEKVALGQEAAKMVGVKSQESRSNNKAFEVYTTAIDSLSEALEKPYTGPAAGLMPALTANQQIADGAVAMMAPIMKQMFRSAGEGSFTDSDQALLMGMIPTRKDKPEARAFKLQAIDSIIRAKLGLSGEESKPQPNRQKLIYNPQTGQLE